jgi:hypothetical protein
MPWRKISLTFVQIEKGAGEQFLNELDTVFITAGYLKDAAVFSRLDLQNGARDYFFSPGAANVCSGLLLRWGGIDCQEPEPEPGTICLIGHPEKSRA